MSDRLDDVERRLTALEQAVATSEPGPPAVPDDRAGEEPFWALEGLRSRIPDSTGAVMFLGGWYPAKGVEPGAEPQAEQAAHQGVEWQFGRLVDDLFDHDWSTATAAMAALGHPVRVDLLKRILTGTTATRDLAETEGLGTSGQLHHHLRILVSAGWLRLRARGDYEVPGPRIIPLMVILSATLA